LDEFKEGVETCWDNYEAAAGDYREAQDELKTAKRIGLDVKSRLDNVVDARLNAEAYHQLAMEAERKYAEQARDRPARAREELDSLRTDVGEPDELERLREALQTRLHLLEVIPEAEAEAEIEFWMSEAIADVEIPSQAGFLLHKKCRLEMQRVVCEETSGPWVVTRLEYLGESSTS
jgi:hypothetical protein